MSLFPLGLLALLLKWKVTLYCLVAVSIISLCTAFCFTLLQKRREQDERATQSYISAFISKHISRTNRYHRPLFLVFSDNNAALDQFFLTMGLELFMPRIAGEKFIEGWHGKDCLLLHVKQLNELEESNCSWSTMLAMVRNRRPRQPFNGILLDLPLTTLSMSPEKQEAYLDCICRYSNQAAVAAQQKLPTLFMLSGIRQLPGYDSFCKSLHRDELTCSLGAIRPEDSTEKIVLWFNSSWQKLLQQLYLRQSDFIGLIYNTQHANDSLEILFQLSTFGSQIQPLIARSSETLLTNRLDVAGYFICPPSNPDDNNRYDCAATYCHSLFSSGNRQKFDTISSEYHSSFLQNIFQQFLLPLANRAGMNKKAHYFYRFAGLSGYGFCCLLLCLSGWWLYRNFTAGKELTNQTRQVLLAYKANTDLLVRDQGRISSLPDTLAKLNSLADLLTEFEQTPRMLVASRRSLQPLQEMLKSYYYQQLKLRLSPYLITALAKSLELQNQKRNTVPVFESLRLYMMLFDSSQLVTHELINHTLSLLAQPAGLNQPFSEQLEQRLTDYLTLPDYIHYQPDSALIQKAQKQLQGMTASILIYNRLKVMPDFKQSIAIANLMGPHFSHVFEVSNSSSCNKYHPLLFTSNSWNNKQLHHDAPLVINSIQDTLKIQGESAHVSTALAVNTLDSVRKLFAQEYITHWHQLLNCIHIRRSSTINELTDIVSLLALLGVSPLTDVLGAVKEHTRFQTAAETNDPGSEDGFSSEGKNTLLTYNQLGGSAGHNQLLSLAFTDYHRLVDENSNGEFFRNLHKHLEEILENLIHLRSADNPTVIAFKQVRQLLNGHHPVLALTLLAEGQPVAVRQWIKQLVSQWGSVYFRLAKQYIENQWLTELVSPWHQTIAGRFPVYGNGSLQIEPDAFQAAFGPGGWIDNFYSSYLKPFQVNANRLQLLEHQDFRLSPELQVFFNHARVIKRFFFNDTGTMADNSINIRVFSLSSDSTHYQLDDGYKKIIYNHGPSLWQKSIYRMNDDDRILSSSFHDVAQQQAAKTYSGPWAWLRFIRESAGEKNGDTIILHHKQDNYESSIELQSASNKNLEALLSSFKRITIPKAVFGV
ncbi:hypothetical protein J7438_10580 [Thalassotalea sp. G20_0]|uniref:ImcF-related family protein n=1 Tax=Thalassotalea sp. G20_0 TaxID=2821093 RepID=UPI001ADCA882|nr:hypothetical protein [Thalassotalea sp. G20_0]